MPLPFGSKLVDGLPVCLCGEAVAAPHKDCLALLTPDEEWSYLHDPSWEGRIPGKERRGQ